MDYYGARFSRYAIDVVKELADQLGLKSADYCTWSMGTSVLWNFVDLFGMKGIHKFFFIDGLNSNLSHADWSELERLDAGGRTILPKWKIVAFNMGTPTNNLVVEIKTMERFIAMDLQSRIIFF